MQELNMPDKTKACIMRFTQGLKEIYGDSLVSVIVYGSAASGEFVDRRSNINLLVVLADTDLGILKKSSSLVKKNRLINPLFLSEDYISRSTDIFPIEFLDMQENYFVIYGKDILKGISIDTSNLRFQCEQELKVKLLALRHFYLANHNDGAALREALLKSFTSVLHIMRNTLRLKGKKPPYKKEELLKELASELHLDSALWEKILAAKNNRIKILGREIEGIFTGFVSDLEKAVDLVDRF